MKKDYVSPMISEKNPKEEICANGELNPSWGANWDTLDTESLG